MPVASAVTITARTYPARSNWGRLIFGMKPPLTEEVAYVGHDYIFALSEGSLELLSDIFLKEPMPPLGGYGLSNDDGDHAVRVLFEHLVDIFQGRIDQRTIGGFNHYKGNGASVSLPVFPHLPYPIA